MGRVGSTNTRTGGNGGVMDVDGGTVDYWQTGTCNPSDAIEYILLLKYRPGELHLGDHRDQTFEWRGRGPQSPLRTAPA